MEENNNTKYITSTLHHGLGDLRKTPEIPKFVVSPFTNTNIKTDEEIRKANEDTRTEGNLVHIYRPIPVNTVLGSKGQRNMAEIDRRVAERMCLEKIPKFAVYPWNNPNITLDKDLEDKYKNCL